MLIARYKCQWKVTNSLVSLYRSKFTRHACTTSTVYWSQKKQLLSHIVV